MIMYTIRINDTIRDLIESKKIRKKIKNLLKEKSRPLITLSCWCMLCYIRVSSAFLTYF